MRSSFWQDRKASKGAQHVPSRHLRRPLPCCSSGALGLCQYCSRCRTRCWQHGRCHWRGREGCHSLSGLSFRGSIRLFSGRGFPSRASAFSRVLRTGAASSRPIFPIFTNPEKKPSGIRASVSGYQTVGSFGPDAKRMARAHHQAAATIRLISAGRNGLEMLGMRLKEGGTSDRLPETKQNGMDCA